jgi:hypothetical protein
MSSNKNFGTTLDNMKFFKQQGFGTVLDVAHAYTFDKSMKLAKQMLKLNPVHIHASGEKDGKHHFPLADSDNRTKMIKFLRGCKVPILLETRYPRRNDKLMKKEISLLKPHNKK